MEGLSASAAFWEQLRSLCLDQFPCGIGSWNKSRFPPRKAKVFRVPVSQQSSRPRRPGLPPPDEETVESLTELLRCPDSPWALALGYSPQEQQLRELAVQSPSVVKENFIFSYFKSLRIVNKNVTEIDAGLLKFPNLEELILSANHISKINSTNLPPTLKVLELCGNEIDSLKDLCALPPPNLQHLGLGRNCQLGSSEERHLTNTFWPNLVSLDLSYNNFTNLRRLLSKLFTLMKLRILVLQGNPLALFPGYRGFTIDSLPKLCTLDDILITPDERHNFLELSSIRELLRGGTMIIVVIGKIRGVPNPVGVDEPEPTPESPVITYSYYVTYEFARGEKMEEKETVKVVISATPNTENSPGPVEGGGGGRNQPVATESPVQPEVAPETSNVHSTPRKPWAETIDCEYRKEHITKDLVSLKAYLLAGTTVSIIEEKLVSWPVIKTPEETPGKKGKGKGEKEKAEKGKGEKGKKEKGKEKAKGKEKVKEEKGKEKDAGKGGNKKKKKSPSPELRSDPPILRTLGSGHVNLERILAGESQVEIVCDFGVLLTEVNVKPPSPKDKESKKSMKKDKKPKSGSDSSTTRKSTPPPKGKGKKKESPDGGDIFVSQPVPLTVEFQMQHPKWKSTSQMLIKPNILV